MFRCRHEDPEKICFELFLVQLGFDCESGVGSVVAIADVFREFLG